MMHAFLLAGSRFSARSTSCRTIWRTSSCVSTSPFPAPTSVETVIQHTSSEPPSPVGPDDREDAVVRPGHATALHLGNEPVAGQPGPVQRRLVRPPPEVARLHVPAPPDRRQVLHVYDAE